MTVKTNHSIDNPASLRGPHCPLREPSRSPDQHPLPSGINHPSQGIKLSCPNGRLGT